MSCLSGDGAALNDAALSHGKFGAPIMAIKTWPRRPIGMNKQASPTSSRAQLTCPGTR